MSKLMELHSLVFRIGRIVQAHQGFIANVGLSA